MKFNKTSGMTIASAALALAVSGTTFVAPTGAAAEEEAKIHCVGVNACKGSSDCKSATNECAGLNDCKGQGFVAMTATQCEKIGGTVEG